MSYLLPTPSPESLIRQLRQEFRARMLGAGLVAGGIVGAPFVLACGSCPPAAPVQYAYSFTPEIAARAQPFSADDDACERMCGGPVNSCHIAQLIPGAPSPESRQLHSPIRALTSGEAAPNTQEVLVCEVMERVECGGIGRPPEGLVARPSLTRDAMVAYAEQAVHLEAASAISFVQLATELELHAAPPALIAAAERSAADELRHARAASSLLASLGGAVTSGPRVRVPAPRALAEILRENAAIGGVEETFGAWVLKKQMQNATDPRFTRFVRSIVDDERRHAHLADQITAWGEPRLQRAERRANAEAVGLAWATLRTNHNVEPAAVLSRAAGVPSASESCEWISARVNQVQA